MAKSLLKELEKRSYVGTMHYQSIDELSADKPYHRIFGRKVVGESFTLGRKRELLKKIVEGEFNLCLRVFVDADNKDIPESESGVNSAYYPYEFVYMCYYFDDCLVIIHENIRKDAYYSLDVIECDSAEYLADKEIMKLFI